MGTKPAEQDFQKLCAFTQFDTILTGGLIRCGFILLLFKPLRQYLFEFSQEIGENAKKAAGFQDKSYKNEKAARRLPRRLSQSKKYSRQAAVDFQNFKKF